MIGLDLPIDASAIFFTLDSTAMSFPPPIDRKIVTCSMSWPEIEPFLRLNKTWNLSRRKMLLWSGYIIVALFYGCL